MNKLQKIIQSKIFKVILGILFAYELIFFTILFSGAVEIVKVGGDKGLVEAMRSIKLNGFKEALPALWVSIVSLWNSTIGIFLGAKQTITWSQRYWMIGGAIAFELLNWGKRTIISLILSGSVGTFKAVTKTSDSAYKHKLLRLIRNKAVTLNQKQQSITTLERITREVVVEHFSHCLNNPKYPMFSSMTTILHIIKPDLIALLDLIKVIHPEETVEIKNNIKKG